MVWAIQVFSDAGICFTCSFHHHPLSLLVCTWDRILTELPTQIPSRILTSVVPHFINFSSPRVMVSFSFISLGFLLKCKISTFLSEKKNGQQSLHPKVLITFWSHVNLEMEHRPFTDYHRKPIAPSTLISFSGLDWSFVGWRERSD